MQFDPFDFHASVATIATSAFICTALTNHPVVASIAGGLALYEVLHAIKTAKGEVTESITPEPPVSPKDKHGVQNPHFG
jgi:hypothetical protein